MVAGLRQAAGAAGAGAGRPHHQRMIVAWDALSCPARGSGGTDSLRGPSAYILYQDGLKSPPGTAVFRAVVLRAYGDSH